MKTATGVIIAGALIAISILLSSYFEIKSHQNEIERCINLVLNANLYGNNVSKDSEQYEALWYNCAKSLK